MLSTLAIMTVQNKTKNIHADKIITKQNKTYNGNKNELNKKKEYLIKIKFKMIIINI